MDDLDEDNRRVMDRRSDHDLLLRLLDGQAELRKELEDVRATVYAVVEVKIDEHVESTHRAYEPDHHEQHKRFGAWLRRIDGGWDKVWSAVWLFLLASVGWGVVTILQSKLSIAGGL